MAKKKTAYKPKKWGITEIIRGNFLNWEEVRAYYKYFSLCGGLLMIMIYCSNLVSDKQLKINALKEQVEEYKSRNAFEQSRLIKVKMESELGRQMQGDSLMPLESHPHKLLLKIDSTNAK
ncbi:MAG: FtsL-like putative cell division protein [Bergeyella zoohelcum]|nr:FtsL-like putative cell division protein [Bergeyella zoohelcum]